MKFGLIAKGTRAERTGSFPFLGDAGEPVEVRFCVRPLTVLEESQVLEFARARGAKAGVKEPAAGDPIYDVGYMLQAVQLATLDPDSPANAREPLFSSTEEIERDLPRETLTYLYGVLEDWRDQCSPSSDRMSASSMLDGIRALSAGGDDSERFLDGLGPASRRIYLLAMAAPALSSLEQSSSSGTSTAAPTTAH